MWKKIFQTVKLGLLTELQYCFQQLDWILSRALVKSNYTAVIYVDVYILIFWLRFPSRRNPQSRWYVEKYINRELHEKLHFSHWGLSCFCSEPVRLVGGSSRCAGTLEVKHGGEWRPVYDSYWSLKEAAVICRELNCGFVVSTGHTEASSHMYDVWWIRSYCVQSGSTLRDCVRADFSTISLEITCSGKPISDTITDSKVMLCDSKGLLLLCLCQFFRV